MNVSNPPQAASRPWTLVELVASMTSQAWRAADVFEEDDAFDDIRSALASSVVGSGNILFIQIGDIQDPSCVLQPYYDPTYTQLYQGFAWKIVRQNVNAKSWQVYDCAGSLVMTLLTEHDAWAWIKQMIERHGAFRVANLPMHINRIQARDATSYACAFIEYCTKRALPSSMFSRIIPDVRPL